MDKNTIVGLLLMVAVFIGFNLWNKPSEEEIAKRRQQIINDSIANVQRTKEVESFTQKELTTQNDDFFTPVAKPTDSIQAEDALNTEKAIAPKTFTLENEKLKLTFSNKGASLIQAQVKDYKAYAIQVTNPEPTDSLYLLNNTNTFGVELERYDGKKLNTSSLMFEQVLSNKPNELILQYKTKEDQYINFIYALTDDYFLEFDLQIVGLDDVIDPSSREKVKYLWSQNLNQLEKSAKNELDNSGIRVKLKGGDLEEVSSSKTESKDIEARTQWIAFKNQFFASIIVADNEKPFELISLSSKPLDVKAYNVEQRKGELMHLEASMLAPANVKKDLTKSNLKFYFGPTGYTHLNSYNEGVDNANKLNFEELIPLGWFLFRIVNKYFIIPIFYLLSNTGLSMGIVILLLTLIVKIVISPLTYKSFMSSAKMRVLKPQVDELSKKYPKPDQAADKQRAIMALYSKAGANPMSGCIPMLLQMPVLIALFRFFPNAIELRQKSFLWAHDLSTYDAIVTFPPLPLIGDHLSLFCILMTITNVIYTKFNMEMTSGGGQEQMPGMKWMMYLMPVVFLFVLNDFPSGLTYYYFISLLITIILTMIFRYTVDEKKVLAKLEANKAKPRKKSGFMARLEEAQRMQQQMQKNKGKKK